MGRRIVTLCAVGLCGIFLILSLVSCPDMDLRSLVEQKIAGAVNVNLSALEISSGTLSPSFSVDVTSYSTWEQSTVTSITVTPTAESSTASITVNGTVVASGTASGDIVLAAGP